MHILLGLILVMTEAAFVMASFARRMEKREWNQKRLVVNALELAAFLMLLLLPGIDLSFRYSGLFLLLIIRLIVSVPGYFLARQKTGSKTKPGMVTSGILSVMLFASALMPAFLFKDYKGRPVTGAYTPAVCSAILTDSSRTEQFETDGSSREIPVHFYYPAESERIADHSLPLVIFSHGAFGWYQSNTSAYQELASNGYVVVSLDHPYHSLFTKDSDGRLITVDRSFMQDAVTIGDGAYADTERGEVFRTESEWISLRAADMQFAVDSLKQAASAHELAAWTLTDGGAAQLDTVLRMINPGKIGLMGHSLGGATAVTVGRREDISAVIDIDGTMIGEQMDFADGKYVINEEPYPTPLLSIDNDEHHFDRIEAAQVGYVYANNVVLDHAKEAYSTYFAGAGHMNLTDLPLISPFFADQFGTGDVDPEQCTDTLNQLILNFFDCYLKEQGTFSVQESY